MKQGRRDFLRQSALATAGAVSLGLTPPLPGLDASPKRRPNPIGFSTHQGFVYPDKDERQRNVNRTIHQIELCYELGIPTMRLNTGRWGPSKSFDELMANRRSTALPKSLELLRKAFS